MLINASHKLKLKQTRFVLYYAKAKANASTRLDVKLLAEFSSAAIGNIDEVISINSHCNMYTTTHMQINTCSWNLISLATLIELKLKMKHDLNDV